MYRIWVIAKWELKRSSLNFTRNTAIAIVFLLLLIAATSAIVGQTGMQMNSKIYTVAVNDPVVYDVIDTDIRFSTVLADPDTAARIYQQGDADVLIIGRNVHSKDTEKSKAAKTALMSTFILHRELTLTAYGDVNNSFPVWVYLHYLDRGSGFEVPTTKSIAERRDAIFEETPKSPGYAGREGDSETVYTVNEAGQMVAISNGGVKVIETRGISPQKSEPRTIEDVADINQRRLFERQTSATPSNIVPPIPFTSVVFAFMFMFPMYFVAQFYSSSIMGERTNHCGEFMLVSPLKKYEIVIGKTLPYLIIMLAVIFFMSIFIRGYVIGDLEITPTQLLKDCAIILTILFPVALMFLAVSFHAALLSRSFKELTFVSVFASTVLSGYLFFPAMFANVHTVSSISPMSLVVQILQNNTITTPTYLFSTIPFYIVSLILFWFGTLIYREEDMFTQKGMFQKIVDSVGLFTKGRMRYVFILGLIAVSFSYMLELMFIVMLFNIPLPYSVFLMIFLAAFTEEFFKSVGIYSLFARSVVPRNLKNAGICALLAGIGFFVGEKFLLILTLAPITDSVFGAVMSMGELLIFPLLLHIAGTAIVSVGLVRWPKRYFLLVVTAAIAHSLYNLFLLRGLLFG